MIARSIRSLQRGGGLLRKDQIRQNDFRRIDPAISVPIDHPLLAPISGPYMDSIKRPGVQNQLGMYCCCVLGFSYWEMYWVACDLMKHGVYANRRSETERGGGCLEKEKVVAGNIMPTTTLVREAGLEPARA
ncbi:MAG: hypothetical protein IJ221_01780 [Oscillibacter sp.]|nr:hypothetical protein [Oscillibacter sp.]